MNTDCALHRKRAFLSNFHVVHVLLLFLALQPVYGQVNVSLNLAPELRNAQILRVSDFNITGSGSVSQLFDLTATNSGASDNFTLVFQLLSDQFGGTPIVEATTQPFFLSTGASRSFTYQDFRNGNIDYNADVVKELTDAILRTGRLPDGTYRFKVSVFQAQQPQAPNGSDEEILEISNPTTLDLISPGAPVGRGECPLQFGLLPQFKWDSNANRFVITVCEVLTSNSSPEEVMQNQPRLQRELQRDLDFFGSPSFIYPSGDLPLEYGKTYYWQIHAIIESPSGEVRLPGEIWCFQISSFGNTGANIMLQQLQILLGSSEFEALFREGGPLYGFSPTGEAILNGRRMSLSELLTELRGRSIRTISMQVE